MGRFAIRWLLHSLEWGLGGSMDAAGRAELGELLVHRSGLAPPPDGADLTSLQVKNPIVGDPCISACEGINPRR